MGLEAHVSVLCPVGHVLAVRGASHVLAVLVAFCCAGLRVGLLSRITHVRLVNCFACTNSSVHHMLSVVWLSVCFLHDPCKDFHGKFCQVDYLVVSSWSTARPSMRGTIPVAVG